MTDYLRKILDRARTREGAGTYMLDCGHQIAVTDADWSNAKLAGIYLHRSHWCHECERNDQHAKGATP